MMRIIEDIKTMQRFSESRRGEGCLIGFVPTMGALHEGHLSLVRASVRECGATVVSIFVNPAQFGPKEDFGRYPRDLEADAALLKESGCQVLLHLDRESMYPSGYRTWVEVEGLSDRLCGRSRPGHFRGVTTVVTKLFHIVRPHRAYFGRKDAQQAKIVERMAADLDFGIEIRVIPTVRDRDGLALSSRNRYLSPEERRASLALPRAIRMADEFFKKGERDAKLLERKLRDFFDGESGLRVDYISLVRGFDLEEVEAIAEDTLLCMAVYAGTTRLIDNHLFSEDAPCSET